MADRESRPEPSRREKGKAKVWEPIELSSDDDQTEGIVPGPVPRNPDPIPSPEEGCFCLSRTLTSHEVDPTNPVFYLDAYEAFTLTDCPGFLEPPSVSYSMNLPVFDYANRVYNMVLSYFVNGDWAGYSVTEDWGEFVKAHNLKAGEKISFYRNLDRAVLDRPFYVLKYVRMSSDVKESEMTEVKVDASVPSDQKMALHDVYDTDVLEKSPDRKKKPGPGSRVMPVEAECLSKTLSAFEVVHDGKPRLFLDAYEAGLLVGCPDIFFHKYPLGTLLENLVVFDGDDRPYDMLLSHFKSDDDGGIIHTVDDGWQRFVKIHNLKAGDEVSFYRLLDESVHYEPYYVVKHTRKELPSSSGSVIGKEPSVGGQKEAYQG